MTHTTDSNKIKNQNINIWIKSKNQILGYINQAIYLNLI